MIPEVELISNTFPAGMLLLVQRRRMMPDAFFLCHCLQLIQLVDQVTAEWTGHLQDPRHHLVPRQYKRVNSWVDTYIKSGQLFTFGNTRNSRNNH